jgi:hypothetical protein
VKLVTFCLVSVAATVVTAVLLALAFGGLSQPVAIVSLAAGLLGGIPAARQTPALTVPRPTPWEVVLLVVFALAVLRSFFWLLQPTEGAWVVQSANNLGDLSKHLHMIRYLAAGASFWPESPFMVGEPLNYYLGVDLLNSLFSLVGLAVEPGLIWVGLVGAALSAYALWRWGGGFALAALLFNGGIAGFVIFQRGEVIDYQAPLAWKNFFLSMFVTQRPLLYALPASLFLWCGLRDRHFRGQPSVPTWVLFLIYATMPLFSAHAFMALSALLLVMFVLQESARRWLFLFVAGAFLPATYFAYLITGGFAVHSGMHWLPGWMQGEEGLWFWLLNFGLSLPLLAVLGWKVAREPDAEARSFVFTGLGLFLVCCLISIAPWPWDNTKIFLWAWLMCAPYLWTKVVGPLALPLRAAVCYFLFFSGAVSLCGGLAVGNHHLVDRSEMNRAKSALRAVPPLELIATEPHHGNPVILLGRPVVCGYEGMLWAHGLNYRETFARLQNILRRGPGWENDARSLPVRWIYTRDRGLEPVPTF